MYGTTRYHTVPYHLKLFFICLPLFITPSRQLLPGTYLHHIPTLLDQLHICIRKSTSPTFNSPTFERTARGQPSVRAPLSTTSMPAISLVEPSGLSSVLDMDSKALNVREWKLESKDDTSLWVSTTEYEQYAAAALLGLHASNCWGSPQSPDSPQGDSDPEPMGGWGGPISGRSSPSTAREVVKAPRIRCGKDGERFGFSFGRPSNALR